MRRNEAQRAQVEQKRAADEAAARTVADARATAEQLIADATHEVRRLHGVRDAVHADLDALTGRVRSALDQSLAATPPEPALPPSQRTAITASEPEALPAADEPIAELPPADADRVSASLYQPSDVGAESADGSWAASANAVSAATSSPRRRVGMAATIVAISRRRASVTRSTSRRPEAVSASCTSRRLSGLSRRVT